MAGARTEPPPMAAPAARAGCGGRIVTGSPTDLGALLEPRSIARLGASEDERRFGGIPLRNLVLHRFPGRLFPVNPKYREVRGLLCYRRVLDVPEEIDVAILSLPTDV